MRRGKPELRGTCQRCKTEQRIVRGRKGARIVEHDQPRRLGLGQLQRCSGSGMRSDEDCAPGRELTRAARREAADRVRADAAVMADALILDDKFVDQDKVAQYRKHAFVEYRMLYEKSQPDRSGVKWKGNLDGTVGLYCVFCGDLIATHPKPWWKRASEPEVWNPVQRHVSICALQCVAGMRKPPPPGTCNVPTSQMGLVEIVAPGDGPLFGGRP